MQKKAMYLVLLAMFLSSLACSVGGAATTAAPAATSASGAQATARPADLYTEYFSDSNSGWDNVSSDNGMSQYQNGEYTIQVVPDQYFIWGNAGQSNLANFHIEVTVTNVGGTTDSGFGLICSYQDPSNFYYLGMSTDGYYAIVKTEHGDDTFLTSGTSQWIPSDLIPQDATSYQLGADCGDGKLILYVNGEKIGSAIDETFTAGDIGLFVETFEQANAQFNFDNVIVTALG